MGTIAIAVCLWTAHFLSVTSATETSHNMWLQKIDTPTVNQSWIDLHNYELKKLNKNAKSMSLNYTSQVDLDSDDFMCEIKAYQNMGGRFLKAPLDIPQQPCCKFFKSNKKIWGCIEKKSSMPEECPIKKGFYWIKEIDPDECNPAENFPSNMPEDYKVTVKMTKGSAMIFMITGYGKLKKKLKRG